MPSSPRPCRCIAGIRSNVLAESTVGCGDCERVFEHADHAPSLSLKQHRGCAHPVEGRGVLARFDQEEDIPYHPEKLKPIALMRCDYRWFSCSTWTTKSCASSRPMWAAVSEPSNPTDPEEAVVPLAARLLGRPVSGIEDRREHFLTSIEERDQYWDLQIAFNSQVEILAVRGAPHQRPGRLHAAGRECLRTTPRPRCRAPTRIPNYRVRQFSRSRPPGPDDAGPRRRLSARRVRHRAPSRSRRGNRTAFLQIASIRRCIVPAAAMPYTTPLKTRAGTPVKYDSGDFPKCQDMALRAIRYDEPTRSGKPGRWRPGDIPASALRMA